jgi:hypothetical protein
VRSLMGMAGSLGVVASLTASVAVAGDSGAPPETVISQLVVAYDSQSDRRGSHDQLYKELAPVLAAAKAKGLAVVYLAYDGKEADEFARRTRLRRCQGTQLANRREPRRAGETGRW